MKRIGPIILGSISLAGCGHLGAMFGPQTVGSGHVKSETRNASGFHRIQVGGATHAEVKVGPKESLQISADDNILPLVRTRVEGGTLIIDVQGPTSTRNGIHATITLPSLDGVEVSGASEMNVAGLHASQFEATLSGASQVKSDGSAQKVQLSLSGASRLDFSHVSSQVAQIDASGASQAKIDASQEISGDLSGASNLRYSGNPKVDVSSSGASSVSKA